MKTFKQIVEEAGLVMTPHIQTMAEQIGTQCYEIARDQLVYDEEEEETKELTYNDGVTDAATAILMYLGEQK